MIEKSDFIEYITMQCCHRNKTRGISKFCKKKKKIGNLIVVICKISVWLCDVTVLASSGLVDHGKY